jgi:uncharacterized protein
MHAPRHLVTALLQSTLLIWGLAGCVGSSAPARLYVLTPGPEATGDPPGVQGPCSLALGVGPVQLPDLLDQAQIVTRRRADEIDRAEFDRWAEPLADSVPRVLVEDLSALVKTERVALFPWDPEQAVRYQIAVNVLRFDGALGGDVVLDARWRILAADGTERAVHRSVLTQPTGGPGYEAVVAAMSRALTALSREIAATLGTLPGTRPGGPPGELGPPAGRESCAGRGSGSARDSQRGQG